MSTYEKILQRKYNDICERSFCTKLDLYIFHNCIEYGNLELITLESFTNFTIDDDLIKMYEKSYQLESGKVNQNHKLDVLEIDKLYEYWDNNKGSVEGNLKENYILIFKEIFPLSDFRKVFPDNESERKCHYCGINENEINKLRTSFKIYTKNFRGKYMEIDRLNSNKEYHQKNIVLACYWCNNAKMDEFTYEEFKNLIGPNMKNIWENRLGKSLSSSI